MLRAAAIKARSGHTSRSARLLARTDHQGKVATTFSGLVNAANTSRVARTIMENTAGIARDRLLPTFANVRFTKWFRRRRPVGFARPTRGTVALFPTCLVEYQQPAIGHAVVGVY